MDKLFQSVALVQQTEVTNKLRLSWQADSNYWEFIVSDRLNKESQTGNATKHARFESRRFLLNVSTGEKS